MPKKNFPLSKVNQLLEHGPVLMLSTSFKEETNVMALSWHMMIGFTPPILACVVKKQRHSFNLLKKSKECVLSIPTVELAKKVVEVGNTSGSKVNKFEEFPLLEEPASKVKAPLLTECYANLECKVIDMKMVEKYNMFILEVVKVWIRPTKKAPRTIHHCGNGVFVVDGDVIKLTSKKK